ncbi:NADH-ubiquinone oxidoreductase-F iron-sulfur binding region domain-containing protein, partial [Desulforudis sp. 1190]|uniref:NADH-ubiquinone oxidoreductase-F iron-sulfur binding region domain-containing protein n=1 Tax=Desulforudis sp. 1190 TaxID=3416136 RepID=UPI003CF50148
MHNGDADQKVVSELARSLLALVRNESCGECLPCWHGVRQIAAVLDKVDNG